MLLGVDKRLNGLIFVLSLLLFSAFSHAAPSCASWSTIGRNSCIINGTCQDKDGGESVTTSCDLSDFTPQKATCGDKSKKHNKVLTRMDKTGITITYAWHERGSFHDGYFQADDQINFKVPQQFAPPLLSAIKKALSQNNCIAAKDLMNGANNGHLCEGGAYCFENTNDDGTKNQCGIMTDGTSRCKISDGKTEETNPDGTPKINIDCSAGQDCRKETDLDGYASQSDKKKDDGESGSDGTKEIKGDSGKTGTGADNDNKSGGQGSAGSNGSQNNDGNGRNQGGGVTGDGTGKGGVNEIKGTPGQDDSNENKGEGGNTSGQGGTGKGGSGTGTGSGGTGSGAGTGNGGGVTGSGKGDKDTADVDLFEAPSLNETFAPLVKVLKDKFSAKVDIGGGDCPKPQFNLMGRSFTVSAHCEILAQLREYFATLMMFLYTFTAIRIVLSS